MFSWWNKIKNWSKKNQEEIKAAEENKKKSEDNLNSILDDLYKSGDPTAYSVLDQSIRDKPSFGPEGGKFNTSGKF